MKDGFINARDFGATGSDYRSAAHSACGSREFYLDSVGDFKVGDEVVVKGAYPHFEAEVLFERRPRTPDDRRVWHHNQPICGRVELDGYDGTQGDWMVYFFDMCPELPGVFRWSKNFGIDWSEDTLVGDGWITLEDGLRVRINDFEELRWGCTAAFACSSRLISKIEKIDGNTVTLADAAGISADCEISHSDSAALQRAIDAAIKEKKSVYLPNGRYRLSKELSIIGASGFTFEGESGMNTVLDNSLGAIGVEKQQGSCFYVKGGDDITLRNLFMVGCYGFDERDKGKKIDCRGGTSVYGFYFQKSNATCFVSPKRVLVENCHARKMSGECFYSMGSPREFAEPTDNYTHSMTYLRCSVEDCARNAFNNNDKSEYTSILSCRIKDVGNAAWEGSSRFTVIQGCYICNTGTEIETGNASRSRIDPVTGKVNRLWDMFNSLGMAQHVISDNYFESGSYSNEPAIRVGSFSSQVIIKGNVFVNYSSPAIFAEGAVTGNNTPSENIIISGNSIDLTAVGRESRERYGIKVTTNFVTVSDNHIFVRGDADEKVKGIVISDDVTRLSVHGNTVAGCGVGIESERVIGKVGLVISDKSFNRYENKMALCRTKPMLLRPASHRYRGWVLHWLSDGTESVIEDFDPYELVFTLNEPREMREGDEFYIYGPDEAVWSIHHNIIDNCTVPLSLDTYSGKRAALDGNVY